MMKFIRTTILMLIILFATHSYGQSYVGVFGGLNSSKLKGDIPEYASYKSMMGANVGAYIDIKLASIIWLSLQPSYSQEGTKVHYTVAYQEEKVDSIHIRLNYFSLPLFLKVSTTNGRFYALGGIEAGMLLSNQISSHGNDLDNDLKLNDWNIAMHFGAGIKIPVGFPRLFVELRYTQGLLNLTDEPVDQSYIPRVKTSGFKILAGIEIPISKIK
jgi:hypothetical protein